MLQYNEIVSAGFIWFRIETVGGRLRSWYRMLGISQNVGMFWTEKQQLASRGLAFTELFCF